MGPSTRYLLAHGEVMIANLQFCSDLTTGKKGRRGPSQASAAHRVLAGVVPLQPFPPSTLNTSY